MVEESFERAIIEYEFLIHHDTEALYAQEIATAEAAFRIPQQDLVITLGSSTLKSYSHDSSTGFDGNPVIVKRTELDAASGRHCRYRVRIEFGLPANNLSTNGRRTSSVNVTYTPARRRIVTISGTFTAIGGTSARGQYEAQIGAFVTSVLNDLGGTYKLAEEPITTHNFSNKTIDFTRVHEEEIFTAVGNSDADVRREVLAISRNHTAPGDTPNVGTVPRLVNLSVRYEVWIDNTASTDLRGKWTSLRGSVITQIENTLDGGSVAITEETPEFDYTDNRITVNMTAVGATTNTVVEYRLTVEDNIAYGPVLVPVWDGQVFSKYKYSGPGTYQRTVTENYEAFTDNNPVPLTPTSRLAPPVAGMKSVVVSKRIAETPIRRGRDGKELNTYQVQRVLVIEFYTEPITTAIGGGSGVQSALTSEEAANLGVNP